MLYRKYKNSKIFIISSGGTNLENFVGFYFKYFRNSLKVVSLNEIQIFFLLLNKFECIQM